MKKTITLLCLSFLLSASLYSQVLQYETEIKYIHGQSGITADITITVTNGKPDFTFILMTNDLMKGEVLMQSEPTKKNSYTFKDVKPGKYLLKITDQTGIQTGKTIIIKDNEN
jgi:hypothetical protein